GVRRRRAADRGEQLGHRGAGGVGPQHRPGGGTLPTRPARPGRPDLGAGVVRRRPAAQLRRGDRTRPGTGPPHLRGARPVPGPAVRHRRAVQLDPPAGDPSMSVWLDPDPLQRTWRSPRRGPRVGRVLLALLLVLVLV